MGLISSVFGFVASYEIKHEKGAKIIMLVVYIKYILSFSYMDLKKMAMIIGIVLDHATCQRWIIKFVSSIEGKVRRRNKPVGRS